MNAQQIKSLRKRLGLTCQELGDRIGVDQSTVYRWEEGTRNARGSATILLKQLAKEAKEAAAEAPAQ